MLLSIEGPWPALKVNLLVALYDDSAQDYAKTTSALTQMRPTAPIEVYWYLLERVDRARLNRDRSRDASNADCAEHGC